MYYSITQTELTCINVLIRTLQEEIENIVKTINKSTENQCHLRLSILSFAIIIALWSF